MEFTFHGSGTVTYGECDYRPDGSFVTTEWFVVAWIPIAPITSKRIANERVNPFATYDRSGYYVHTIVPLVRTQVARTYAWFLSVIGGFAFIIVYEGKVDQMSRSGRDVVAAAVLAWLATMVALPFLLRWLAMRRKRAEWRRQNLGLPAADI